MTFVNTHAATTLPEAAKAEEKVDKAKLLAAPLPHARPSIPPPVVDAEQKAKLDALQKKKSELRQQQIAQQKQLLDMMSKKLKEGNLTPREKEDLLKTIKTSTDALQALFQKEQTALLQKKEQAQQQAQQQQPLTPAAAAAKPPPNVKDVMKKKEKERLDRELDLLSRSGLTSSGGATASLSSSTSSLPGDAPPSVPSPPSSAPTAAPAPNSPPKAAAPVESPTLSRLQNMKKDLEQQAISMGLDPSSLHKIPTSMGRGRGRGGMPPRGGAGAARGRGRGGMSLDMRPTSLLISNLPDELVSDGAIRAHFQTFGDLSSVEFPASNAAVIQFVDRFRAEAAIANGRQYKNQQLRISWYTPNSARPAMSEPKHAPSAAEAIKDEPEQDLSSSTASLDQTMEEPYGHFDEEEEDTERSWKH